MKLQEIFFDEIGRLRSGFRFAIFFAIFFIAFVFSSIIVSGIIAAIPGNTATSLGTIVLTSLAALGPAVFAGWICNKWLENLPFRALGGWFTKGWLKHFLLGLAAGTMALVFGVLLGIMFGGLSFDFNAEQGSTAILITLGVSFLIFAVSAAFEEVLFRGYILQTFARSGYAWFAIVLTSVFFGVVHLGNPNAGLVSTLNTMLAGIVFSVAYLRTRDLWFVWGMHLTWNWVQGSFFGIEVSGLTEFTTAPLLKEIDKGPAWLTGETYGIEGGIICTVALIAAAVIIHFLPIFHPSEEMIAFTSVPIRDEAKSYES